MSNKLEGKVILITGAASGFGKEAAIKSVNEGAKVALLDKNGEALEETAAAIREKGGEALLFTADITEIDSLKAAAQSVIDHYGKLDSVFANAGILGVLSPIEDFPIEDWKETLNTNITGSFQTVQSVIPYLKEKGGSIVLTASVSGVRQFSQLGFSAYSTSKAAVTAFAKMAAYELSQYNIRVNTINPGSSETNIFDSGKETDSLDNLRPVHSVPELAIPLDEKKNDALDIANLFIFLASDEAKRITGSSFVIDGGETLLKG